MGQKGFGHILLLLGVIAVFAALGVGYYLIAPKTPKISAQSTAIASENAPPASESASSPTTVSKEVKPSPSPILLRKTYTNPDFKFSFTYPAVLALQTDSEEDYSKRNNGDARANFTGYVKYAPEKVLAAVSLLGKDASFDNSLFTVWVFDNPNSLTAQDWFNKYWYYPFLWGVFNDSDKKPLEPSGEASISGQIANFKKVDYQQGSPKYFYLTKGGKMFLFRLLEGSDATANHIIETFKFTD